MRLPFILTLLALSSGCGPKPPPRYVLEHDIGSYKLRRYQQVLDVEISIPSNAAVGHTATYVRPGKQLQVVPVFVTVYEKPAGLVEDVRLRLRKMQSYTFDITQRSGANLFLMRGEGQDGDSWLLWVSGARLIKLGAPAGQSEVPKELLDAYLDQYPSDLDDHGKAIEGRSSAGPASAQETEPSADGAPAKSAK